MVFPNPGPTFPMVVMDAVKAVIPSIFIAARSNVITKKIIEIKPVQQAVSGFEIENVPLPE